MAQTGGLFRLGTSRLWHTKDFTTPSSISAHVPHYTEDFVLDFVPDRQLAVVARQEEKTVTVLDLKSGLPQLTIDTPMEVCGLRVAGNTVVVIGDGVVITWNLPEGNSLPHARVGVKNSIQTISFDGARQDDPITASISLDFRYVAVLEKSRFHAPNTYLIVYCLSTGHCIRRGLAPPCSLWFAPGSLDIWSAARGMLASYTMEEYSLRCRDFGPNFECAPPGLPWRSPRGCKVTNNVWLVDPDGKRLFMLPPPWRSYAERQVWNGQFLVLLHGSLPQPVILELAP